jgi:hypothetical protein
MILPIWRTSSSSEIVGLLANVAACCVHVVHSRGEMMCLDLETMEVRASWQARADLEGSRFRFRAHQFRGGILAHDLTTIHHWDPGGAQLRIRDIGSSIRSVAITPADCILVDTGSGIVQLLSPELATLKEINVAPGRVTHLLPVDGREALIGQVDRVSRIVDGEVVGQILMPSRVPPLIKYPLVGLARLAWSQHVTLVQTMSGGLLRVAWDPQPRLNEVGRGYVIGTIDGAFVTWHTDGLSLWELRDGQLWIKEHRHLDGAREVHAIFASRHQDEILIVGEDYVSRMIRWSRLEPVVHTIREITAETALPGGGVLFAIGRDLCRAN